MDSVIGKAIDLVCQYTIVPIARQLKYVFCYKSSVLEMKDAIHKLQNEKEIVDSEKHLALQNMWLIHTGVEDWLGAVTNTQEEVGSLLTYQESKAKMSGCCMGEQIVNPIARHKLGRRATKKKLAIEDLHGDRPHADDISYPPPPPGIVDHQATSSAAPAKQQNDGVFRSSRWKEIMDEILTALQDNNINNVIGLHGMGGVGKSTMVKEVHDQVKKQGMFDEVAKVEVKVKPEIRRIQEEIAFALGLRFENESTAIRAEQLSQRLLRKKDEKNDIDQKKKKTVLIILDDLWEKLNLQEVGIPLGCNDQVHIKLFLISRHEYLLSYKMGALNPIHLDVLSDADALRMFKFFVGGRAEGVEENEVAKTTRKCSGLPIVIEVTAKALKNRTISEWERILKRLDNDDVLEKLKVSYDYLPIKQKELFLICGIIRGPYIHVRDLLKFTFGLRLYNRKDCSTLVDASAMLEKLLSGLEAASMLLKSDDCRYIKIHDYMRSLAVNIVEADHPEWAYDVTLSDSIFELHDASKLKLLISCCEGDAMELRDLSLKDMKNLNVLEFTNSPISLSLSSPAIALDHPRNLRVLCLHNCSLVDISMIGELKGLQILSFRGSDICKLPIKLGGLTSLKMLDLSDCVELTEIEPTMLGSLTKLEELNMENSFKYWEIEGVAPSSNARLIELKNMSRLSNVRIHIPSTSMLPKDGHLFSSKLYVYQIMFGVSHIKAIEDCDSDDELYDDEDNKFSRVLILTFDSPHILWQDWVQTTLQTAEVLYLSGRLDTKCESIGEMCTNSTKGFECLKHLRIRDCPSFRFIISSNDASSINLESLYLEKLESLESLCGGLHGQENAFSKLRVIKIDDCNKLTYLFDFSLLKTRISSQLEEIIVRKCAEIQSIVVDKDGLDNEAVTLSNVQKLEFRLLRKFSSFCAGTSSNILFSGKKVAFPCLESLLIDGLDELEHIWHPTDPPAELGKLQFLEVERCNKLVRVINSNVLMRLQRDLESLSIYWCGSMKEVFEVDQGIISSCKHLVLFSRLKKLHLQQNRSLESLYITHSLSSIDTRVILTTFPDIETLKVFYCDGLRYVLSWSSSLLPPGVGGFVHLRKIKIGSCKRIEAIVMMSGTMVDQETQQAADAAATVDDNAHHDQNYNAAVSYSYSSLKEIMIHGCCPQLRTFCQYFCSEHESSIENLPFFSQKEIFPCLESLDFEGLSKLGEIWPHEVPPQTSFNTLKQVRISNCPELSVLFPSTLIPCLENLTDIYVQNCDRMRQIMIVEERKSKCRHAVHGGIATTAEMMFSFPCLRKLVLKDLVKLDRFYSSSSSSSSACTFQFPYLETLEIWRCHGVKTLFSDYDGVDHDLDLDMVGALFRYRDGLAISIPNMKSMKMSGLENLTEIWKGENPQGLILKLDSLILNGCSSSYANFQSLLPSFCSVLTQLTVESSHGLKYLLTSVGASSLVHLISLSIGKCKNIREVVLDVEAMKTKVGIIIIFVTSLFSTLKSWYFMTCPGLRNSLL